MASAHAMWAAACAGHRCTTLGAARARAASATARQHRGYGGVMADSLHEACRRAAGRTARAGR